MAAGFATAIDVFAMASARLYDEIAFNDFQPFKQRLAIITHDWASHRLRTSAAHQMRRSS